MITSDNNNNNNNNNNDNNNVEFCFCSPCSWTTSPNNYISLIYLTHKVDNTPSARMTSSSQRGVNHAQKVKDKVLGVRKCKLIAILRQICDKL